MMRQSNEIRFVLSITVHDVEGFVAAVEECVAISKNEPGTLLYEWYLDAEKGTARLYEAYADVDAVIAHAAGPVFTDVGPRLLRTCTFDHMDAFGDLGRLAAGDPFWPTTIWGSPIASLGR